MRKQLVKGFTFLELVIVIAIIGVLVTFSTSSYTSLLKKSRDSKRKADIEEVRAALELYRSNSPNSNYPVTLNELIAPTVYIQRTPVDPLSAQTYTYVYQPTAGCNNSTVYCTDYTIAALLEGASTCQAGSVPSASCRTSPATNCNYCVGPYGQK